MVDHCSVFATYAFGMSDPVGDIRPLGDRECSDRVMSPVNGPLGSGGEYHGSVRLRDGGVAWSRVVTARIALGTVSLRAGLSTSMSAGLSTGGHLRAEDHHGSAVGGRNAKGTVCGVCTATKRGHRKRREMGTRNQDGAKDLYGMGYGDADKGGQVRGLSAGLENGSLRIHRDGPQDRDGSGNP